MRKFIYAFMALPAALALFVATTPGASAAKPPKQTTTTTVASTTTTTAPTSTIPKSMDALGDSITRAFNACGWFFDCTERSWSTGTYSGLNSHAQRLKAKGGAQTVANHAVSGAEMIDLQGQAANVAAGTEYVTILLGANDACASSEDAMTPVATYRSQLEAGMATLVSRSANVKIALASIPDIHRLWEIGKDSSSARNAWDAYGICQSMLANPTSTAQADVDRRARVRQRVIDYNTQLAEVCALYANCRFDNNAGFNFQFTLSHMSTWDYFHPNTEGQKVVADVTYRNTWNF